MSTQITASMLYDLVECPHRVTMDLYAVSAERDPISPFVQLLWERGNLYEKEVIEKFKLPFTNLSKYQGSEKERLTWEAIGRGDSLIYAGRIATDDLLGEPDLLRREANGYVPGDIKAASAEEGPEDHRKLKERYAVQLALYVDILERKRLSAGRRGFIWDIQGAEVPYDLASPKGQKTPRTLWDEYLDCLATARRIVNASEVTVPAYSSVCKNCHWYSACLNKMTATDDLTLIPELGRSRRDSMVTHVSTIREFAGSDLASFLAGKKTIFKGIGPDMLAKLQGRAKLQCARDAKPNLHHSVVLPTAEKEIFFDVETDPFRGICYLHGFIERQRGDDVTEQYISFMADQPTPEDEENAFAAAWSYLTNARPHILYFYSKYERTIWRDLRERYPSVCTEAELEAVFDRRVAVDLYYDVVLPKTDWPTRDYSIKTLAGFLGFQWRDQHPSGAASIEWFDRWIRTSDPAVKQRILEYNEDDCRAMRVLSDYIRGLVPP